MSQLTLNLSEQMASMLAEIGRQSNRPAEDIAREMIERAIRVSQFDRARRKIIDALGPDAPQTDEEAFEQIS